MAAKSKIEWTEATWNPVRGCTKISAGCTHCYAETFSERFRGVKNHPFEFGFDLRLVPKKLLDPLRWRAPKKIFVNSMSDLFHEDIPDAYIFKVFQIMQLANWHTFQVLTKRAPRMKKLLKTKLKEFSQEKHIWLGVSVENQKHGVKRINQLRLTNIPTRFLSIEPLLEELGELNLDDIDWVIVGGESGPRARPMNAEWVKSIQKQCKQAGVPFFFKQWGGVQKSKNGRLLDGRLYNEIPKITNILPPNHTNKKQKIELALSLV